MGRHQNNRYEDRFRKLRRLSRPIAFIVVLLIIIVGIIVLPLLIGLASALLNGDLAAWIEKTSSAIQSTIKPITDVINALQGLIG